MSDTTDGSHREWKDGNGNDKRNGANPFDASSLSHQDTIPSSNKQPSRHFSSLSELFEDPSCSADSQDIPPAPPPPKSSNDGGTNLATDNSDNNYGNLKPSNSSSPQQQQQLHLKKPPSIANHHQRTISWGNNVNFRDNGNNTQRHNFNGGPVAAGTTTTTTAAAPPPSPHPLHRHHHRRLDSQTPSLRRLQLEDVLGPLELEAETHILKALEQRSHGQQQQGRSRSDTATSTILSNVPDDMGHDFVAYDERSFWEPAPPPPPLDNEDDNNNNNNDVDDDDEELQQNNSLQDSSKSQQAKPLLRSPNSQNNRLCKQHQHLHRRTQSVEQKLHGLTQAMVALNRESSQSPYLAAVVQQGNHHHNFGGAGTAGTAENDDDMMMGSADHFAANAVKLAQRAGKEEIAISNLNNSSSNSKHKSGKNTITGGGGGDRWQFLMTNLPTLKEHAGHNKNNNSDNIPGNDEISALEAGQGEEEEDDRDDEEKCDTEDESSDNNEENNDSSAPENNNNNNRDNNNKKNQRRRRQSVLGDVNDKIKEDWALWNSFFRLRQQYLRAYLRMVLLYLIIPATGIAAILFYLADNDPGKRGKSEDNQSTAPTTTTTSSAAASASWWLLFVCVRQVVTFSLALATQALVIDFLALGTRLLLNLVGPIITLLIVQSKGWPFIVLWWAIYDFALLSGGRPFAAHWAYWQTAVDMMNASNPSGNVVTSDWNTRILTIAICVSLVTTVKRFVVGLHLGRQTYSHHGDHLAKVMEKMLLISEVASLARSIEKYVEAQSATVPDTTDAFGWNEDHSIRGLAFTGEDKEDGDSMSRRSANTAAERVDVVDTSARDAMSGSLRVSERQLLMQLLEEWEEPDSKYDREGSETANISAVLNFRKALTFINRKYPFSYSFGPAHTRAACIDSAQDVYHRLSMRRPSEDVLSFETIALVSLTERKEIDQGKAKELVRLFRPDRKGLLSMLDFVKSVDAVYKEFRLLEASINNSAQIDRAFENIINVVFYTVMVTVILSQLGFDPLALFLSLSSVILAFAFMIGSASSKYFEGLLFILMRRPYGIGDRFHSSHVEKETSMDGSPGWVVENVTLFETTAIWTPTKERASFSNGSLASSRIINMARSPNPQFFIFLKFPIDVPYEKILVFKSAVEEYMKARPREWLSLNGFRANKVATDLGWVEYYVAIQHRASWQNVGQILDSKANFISFCQEVSKQLDIHYRAPPLPVDLKYMKAEMPGDGTSEEVIDMDSETRTKQFRSLALSKHNIRMS